MFAHIHEITLAMACERGGTQSSAMQQRDMLWSGNLQLESGMRYMIGRLRMWDDTESATCICNPSLTKIGLNIPPVMVLLTPEQKCALTA